MRVPLTILGILLLLGAAAGLALAVERHLAYAETMERWGGELEKAHDAADDGDSEALDRYAGYAEMDADTADRQGGERNLYAGAAGAALVLGVLVLLLARRKKSG